MDDIVKQNEPLTNKAIAIEMLTWGNWIKDIERNQEAIKIIEVDSDMYMFIHKGQYVENKQSSLKTYVFSNLARDDKDLPCSALPCYLKGFACIVLNKMKTVSKNNFNTISISYNKNLPPKDYLIITGDGENDKKYLCDIKRRSECRAVSNQKNISCDRSFEGVYKTSHEGKFKVNLFMPGTSCQDLL